MTPNDRVECKPNHLCFFFLLNEEYGFYIGLHNQIERKKFQEWKNEG